MWQCPPLQRSGASLSVRGANRAVLLRAPGGDRRSLRASSRGSVPVPVSWSHNQGPAARGFDNHGTALFCNHTTYRRHPSRGFRPFHHRAKPPDSIAHIHHRVIPIQRDSSHREAFPPKNAPDLANYYEHFSRSHLFPAISLVAPSLRLLCIA